MVNEADMKTSSERRSLSPETGDPGPRREAPAGRNACLDAPLSVVVVVNREVPDMARVHATYRQATRGLAPAIEYVYLVDGPFEGTIAQLRSLAVDAPEPVVVLAFPRSFGEASLLSCAFAEARGEYLLTLPLDPGIELSELPKLCEAVRDVDLVVCRRVRGEGEEKGPRGKFELVTRLLLRSAFTDLRCGVRLLRRPVAEELVLYGNQHRFLPLIAEAQGFRVREVPVRVRGEKPRKHWVSLSPLLDVLTVYFLLKFVQKPFRFFGGFGLAVLAVGGLGTAWLVAERLLFGVPLAERPALILSSLLIVLGIQIIAVGLIGEIVAFAHARSLKEYRVERVVG